ncbi:MAG: alpha/beta hydrolase [Lachnospiraceae bacterium]|nr:alpha/beta hydrolase [Lachnospiraceae bacterium]
MIYQELTITPLHEKEGAKLYTYVIDNTPQTDSSRIRPAVIICPGGGYQHLSDREAEPIALQYMAAGIQAFVLKYSLAPTEYPCQLKQLAQAVKTVREHADEWHVDPNCIIVSGFSAGGHVAGSLAVNWNKEWLAKELGVTNDLIRPNGCVLCYPVITSGEFAHRGSFENLLGGKQELLDEVSLEKQVNEDVPPVFIWHTFTDQAVPVENSLLFVNALRKYKIVTEFHMYPIGGHGLALATEETRSFDGKGIQPECAGWIRLATDWVNRLGGKSC